MAVEKYTALANITLTSSASSVTFGSIPSGYRDLRLVMDNVLNTSGNGYHIRYQLNSDTSTSYSSVAAWGNGTSTGSDTYSSVNYGLLGFSYSTSTYVGNVLADFMDYSQTDKHTSAISRASMHANRVDMTASRFGKTDAITSITLFNESSVSFASGTTFELYGVK